VDLADVPLQRLELHLGVTAAGGTHVCLSKVDPARVWELLDEESITHLCGAPTVLTSLAHHPSARARTGRRVIAAVGGAPPTPALLERCTELGLEITHLYGLTETFGPVAICDWRQEWNQLSIAEQACAAPAKGRQHHLEPGASGGWRRARRSLRRGDAG